MQYSPREIENKWRSFWQKNETYKVSNESDRPKYYVLDMFPYPSGSGLHVGHPLGYIASDIFSRYKRLCGFNVLHPMGYDAFGLPAEQYAISRGVHPAESTAENIKKYRSQLDNLGFSFDWSRQVNTSDPSYYKWTQWIFLQLFDHYYDLDANKALPISGLTEAFAKAGSTSVKSANSQLEAFSAQEWNAMTPVQKDEVLMNYRLVFRKVGHVNWCEALGTVLANDEVKDGLSERGGHPVMKRPMVQWSLRTTAYAERLLNGLDDLDWPEPLKAMQRNWIGRSEGARVFFNIADSTDQIEVFTTRPDTIFGATFMVLAPEHDLVAEITTAAQRSAVDDYLEYVGSRSDIDRMSEVKTVTGAFTGAYAINPFTETKVPIWIAEYVLKDYGTGAIMAVPSDDDRDKRFAEKFGIEIIDVVDKSDYPGATLSDKIGKMINSDFLNGMEVKDAIKAANAAIDERGIGERQINYRLRDANFTRQRYWGEPVPITYDQDGVAISLKTEELPLTLPPLDDFKPTAEGRSPLARLTDWTHLEDGRTRETDTMPGYAGSSWYFLRYMDAQNETAFAGKAALDYWQDVDLYIGGAEHAVGHLLYSRTWHKFLHDIGAVPTEEPYKKLVNQGMIQGVIESALLLKSPLDGKKTFISADLQDQYPDHETVKISVPIEYVSQYGNPNSFLDAAGLEQFKAFWPDYQEAVFITNTKGELVTNSEVGKMSKRYYNVINPDDIVEQYGADCFRLFEMFLGPIEQSKPFDIQGITGVSSFLKKFWHLFYDDNGWAVDDSTATKEMLKVTHTCIKKVTEDIERFSFNTCVPAFMVVTNDLRKLKCRSRAAIEPLVALIAPFAPHLAEELWAAFGNTGSVHHAAWPAFDEAYLKEDSIEYPISINGKKRAVVAFPADASKAEIEAAALALPDVQKWTEGKEIKRVIVVPKRMVNIVV